MATTFASAATAGASGIDGEWDAKKDCCSMGYTATWVVTETGDELTVDEQPGSHCCGCVPNCCRKTGRWAHKMTKSGDEWKGRLGGKNIRLTIKDQNTLAFVTTDGPMTMTRK